MVQHCIKYLLKERSLKHSQNKHLIKIASINLHGFNDVNCKSPILFLNNSPFKELINSLILNNHRRKSCVPKSGWVNKKRKIK